MNENIKICFLIPTTNSGGIETYLLRFLKYLNKVSEITVIVRNSKQGELTQAFQTTGVRLLFMPIGYINLRRIVKYFFFFKNEKFDVVCDFNANFAGLPMFLAKQTNVKKRIAFYRQGRDHFSPSFIRNQINDIMNSLVNKNATHILSNSKAALDFFFKDRNSQDRRFQVLYNGVNIETFKVDEDQKKIRENLGLPIDKYIVGHVGRLDPAKNHTTIINVAERLSKTSLPCHFVLCGRETEKLQSLVNEKNLINYITILGYREDIPRVLKAFDLFFFPSLTEGQPNALIEAMIAGLPIVASNIAPIKECVPPAHWQYLEAPLRIDSFCLLIKQSINYNQKLLKKYAYAKFNHNINFGVLHRLLYDINKEDSQNNLGLSD